LAGPPLFSIYIHFIKVRATKFPIAMDLFFGVQVIDSALVI
jgi:hypothetical protein